jgi:glutamine synthetase
MLRRWPVKGGNTIHTQLIEELKADPQGKVKIAVVDIDGVLRGKIIHRDKFLSILESGFGFCDVVLGWDMGDVCYDNASYTGWHSGYPDALAALDLKTFRRVPWDNKVPFFLADFREKNGSPLPICPRGLLKRIAAQAADAGFAPVFSQEFEWFNFRETSQSLAGKGFRDPEPITEGMFGYSLLRASENQGFFNDLFTLLGEFGVPIEGLHTETGPGVYEAAILYDDVLEAGDRAVLFKAGVKEIGRRHGILPTFMAKWHSNLPGCGGHVHQSLWDRDKKKNLFFDASDENKISELMRHYIAGLLHCLPELLPLYAPTINSYKRLVEGVWAPTSLSWGIDNRTTAVRALPGSAKSTRVEFRVIGSDVNPYLVMAAALASGLYGIKKRLKLDIPATRGSAYGQKRTLARDLGEATEKLKRSELARELLGDAFVTHFVETREWEWRQYEKAVTDWELKRYFETI